MNSKKKRNQFRVVSILVQIEQEFKSRLRFTQQESLVHEISNDSFDSYYFDHNNCYNPFDRFKVIGHVTVTPIFKILVITVKKYFSFSETVIGQLVKTNTFFLVLVITVK